MPKYFDKDVAAVLRGARGFGTYPWPGKPTVKVAIRVATDGEIDDCRLQAQLNLRDWAKKRNIDPVAVVDIDPDHFPRLQQREIIFRTVYDLDTVDSPNPERFFTTAHEITLLTSSEVGGLFELYLQHQTTTTPLREAGEEEVAELLEAMGKGHGVPAFLAGFEHSTLLRLVTSMASKLRAT